MATREFRFTVGPETSTLPAVATPSASTDILTKGYADANYARGDGTADVEFESVAIGGTKHGTNQLTVSGANIGLSEGDLQQFARIGDGRGNNAGDALTFYGIRKSTTADPGDWVTQELFLVRDIDSVATQGGIRFGSGVIGLLTGSGVERVTIASDGTFSAGLNASGGLNHEFYSGGFNAINVRAGGTNQDSNITAWPSGSGSAYLNAGYGRTLPGISQVRFFTEDASTLSASIVREADFSGNLIFNTYGGVGGISFNVDGASYGSVNASGAWSYGPDTGSVTHTFKSGTSGNAIAYLKPGIGFDLYGTISNGGHMSYRVESAGRISSFGVLKHAGITNNAPYIFLQEEDGGQCYYWTDNNGIFRSGSHDGLPGTTGGTAVGDQTSDIRLKDNIGPVIYGLDTVLAINPISFNFIGSTTSEIGFSAQDMEALVPEAVYNTMDSRGDIDNIRAFKSQALIPVLWNAVKELKQAHDELKNQIEGLLGAAL